MHINLVIIYDVTPSFSLLKYRLITLELRSRMYFHIYVPQLYLFSHISVIIQIFTFFRVSVCNMHTNTDSCFVYRHAC